MNKIYWGRLTNEQNILGASANEQNILGASDK